MPFRYAAGRELWLVAVPSTLLVLAVLAAAVHYGEPLPPDRLVITTAPPGSGYARFAERYRDRLAREGVRLEIRHSAGSAENYARLRAPDSGVDVAFTTVGAGKAEDHDRLASLGGMFPSPLFVFYRGEETITRFAQFRGKRISIGTTGTFLRALVTRVLEQSGALEGTTLSDLPPEGAFKALIAGELDALMIPSPLDAPLVRTALRHPGVRLMNVAQADAIARRVPELRHVVLPRGGIDLARDEPAEDVHLLASINSVVVRSSVHPSLQLLLLDAAAEVHAAPGMFQRFAEYPAPQAQDLPLSDTADRFYRTGRPFLYRHLGFRLAALADRIGAIMLPMMAALIPVLGYAPTAYRWLNRRRIWRWYEELASIEAALVDATDPGAREGLLARLDAVDTGIRRTRVARPYVNELYHLHAHAASVRERVRAAPG